MIGGSAALAAIESQKSNLLRAEERLERAETAFLTAKRELTDARREHDEARKAWIRECCGDII